MRGSDMTTRTIPSSKEQVLPSGENLFKALLLVAALVASFYGADRLAGALDATSDLPRELAASLKWGAVALFAVADVVLLTGMGVLAHDAVHRVLFRSAFWNDFLGGLLSALALIPFHANRQFHLTHHGYAHQPGLDPENVMHERPFWQAATVGSVVALKEQYRLFLANVLRTRDPRSRARALKDAASLTLAGAFFFAVISALEISLAVTVVPMALLFPLALAFRSLSDHYGIPPVERAARRREEIFDADESAWHADRERREREVRGWVVLTAPWLEWLWSHVNYHEVHHKYPYLSHRYLPQAFEATRGRHSYLVVRGYWRSLLNLRGLPYYSRPEDVRPFAGGRAGLERMD